MVSKKSTKKADAIRFALKQLKRYGFINFDLRKPLDYTQQSYVADLIKEHKHLITAPEEYAIRRVSDKTKEDWSKHGFVTTDKYLIIPKQGYDTIHVKGDKITRSVKNKKGRVVKKETTYSYSGLDLYNKLTRTFNRPLAPREFVTLKIGDSAPFKHRYKDLKTLLNYISNWQPKDKTGQSKEDLIELMSVVRFYQ